MRETQVLHGQVVDTGLCLCVGFPLTLITAASMGVNESWMRFSRVFEPVNTVFSITGPSLYCRQRFLGITEANSRRLFFRYVVISGSDFSK